MAVYVHYFCTSLRDRPSHSQWHQHSTVDERCLPTCHSSALQGCVSIHPQHQPNGAVVGPTDVRKVEDVVHSVRQRVRHLQYHEAMPLLDLTCFACMQLSRSDLKHDSRTFRRHPCPPYVHTDTRMPSAGFADPSPRRSPGASRCCSCGRLCGSSSMCRPSRPRGAP